MKETEYAGIDYSLGQSNRDDAGVSYGIIPVNSLFECIWDSVESEYGDPHCPECGNRLNEWADFDYSAECGVFMCKECQRVAYPMEIEEGRCPECAGEVEQVEFKEYGHYCCRDHACHSCKLILSSEDCYPDEPIGNYIDDDDLKGHIDDSNDFWTMKSPFVTRAQFCSPCAPGAGHLSNPCESGPVTYCPGHDWFDGQTAPYPVVDADEYIASWGKRLIMVLPDGSRRQYQNWETIFAVWRMRKGV